MPIGGCEVLCPLSLEAVFHEARLHFVSIPTNTSAMSKNDELVKSFPVSRMWRGFVCKDGKPPQHVIDRTFWWSVVFGCLIFLHFRSAGLCYYRHQLSVPKGVSSMIATLLSNDWV